MIRKSTHLPRGRSRQLGFRWKLSEKSRTYSQRGPVGRQGGAFRSNLAFVHLPNPRSERCSDPFSDSFWTEFSEVRREGISRAVLLALGASARSER